MMKILRFTAYYCWLRLKIFFGMHLTANPTDLRWRWKYWNQQRERAAKRRALKK